MLIYSFIGAILLILFCSFLFLILIKCQNKTTDSQEFILKKILLLEFNLNYFDNELLNSKLISKYEIRKIVNAMEVYF